MTAAALFFVVALRAIVELLLWLIIGRATLKLLAGQSGADNAILQLFDIVLNPLRALLSRVWPRAGFVGREYLLFGLLLSIWLSLAVAKWWLTR